MSQNRKGTGTKPAPTTINDHIIIDRLSLLFFTIFLVIVIVVQFRSSDKLLGFGFGMGFASLFCHCVAMKLDADVRRFDEDL